MDLEVQVDIEEFLFVELELDVDVFSAEAQGFYAGFLRRHFNII